MRKLAVGSVVLVAALAAAPGCAGTSAQPETPQTATGPAGEAARGEDAVRLPRNLEALDLSARQRARILALRDELDRRLAPMEDAAREYRQHTRYFLCPGVKGSRNDRHSLI